MNLGAFLGLLRSALCVNLSTLIRLFECAHVFTAESLPCLSLGLTLVLCLQTVALPLRLPGDVVWEAGHTCVYQLPPEPDGLGLARCPSLRLPGAAGWRTAGAPSHPFAGRFARSCRRSVGSPLCCEDWRDSRQPGCLHVTPAKWGFFSDPWMPLEASCLTALAWFSSRSLCLEFVELLGIC